MPEDGTVDEDGGAMLCLIRTEGVWQKRKGEKRVKKTTERDQRQTTDNQGSHRAFLSFFFSFPSVCCRHLSCASGPTLSSGCFRKTGGGTHTGKRERQQGELNCSESTYFSHSSLCLWSITQSKASKRARAIELSTGPINPPLAHANKLRTGHVLHIAMDCAGGSAGKRVSVFIS